MKLKCVVSENHHLHHPSYYLTGGNKQPFPEIPSRIEIIKDALIAHNLVEFISRNDYGLSPLLEVHTREYIQYLEQAYSLWIDKGGDVNGVIPEVFAVALQQVYHEDSALNSSNFYAQAARFTFDTAAPIAEHTFKTVYEGAQCALTCAEILMATRSPTFALIRPPGHHSSQSLLGGFCFVNNVAVAAEYIIQRHHKVAILDVDYHAGNGTQDIYYTRKNPLFCSIHGENDYPYLWGSSGEIGSKDGKGFNYNFPLPFGTGDELYLKTLNDVINTVIRPYRPDFLLISLGVDTYSGDPVGTFNVSSEGFWEIGRSIGSLQLPTLFVMEGGYAVNEIGENVSNVFRGFLSSNVP